MRRRDVLGGLGSLAVLGGGGALYTHRRSDGTGVDPVTIETIAAPGSEAGRAAVPQPGTVTFLEVFATWCSTCRGMMPTLRTVHDRADVGQFVSVSNEPIGTVTTRADVGTWWRDHGGQWPVGVDTDLDLTAALDVRTVPTSFVFDEDNRIRHAETGQKSTETLLDWLESV